MSKIGDKCPRNDDEYCGIFYIEKIINNLRILIFIEIFKSDYFRLFNFFKF